MKNILKDFFEKNSEKYLIDMAFLFGSQTADKRVSESDIDIAIIFSGQINSEDKIFELLNEISIKISELTGKNVDIICIQDDFRYPMLYYNAIVLGTLVFVKDRGKYFNFRMFAIEQMEDFGIFGIKWQLEVAERLLKGLNYA